MFNKKIISVLLSTSLLLASFVVASANDNEDEKQSLAIENVKQAIAMKNYEKLYNKIAKNSQEGMSDIYGGSYIDGEGNLVFNLVEDKKSINNESENLKKLVSENEVKFRYVKHSINELDRTQDKLNGNMVEFEIKAIARDEINNKLIIYLSDLDELKIGKIKKFADVDFIEFKKTDVIFSFSLSDAYNGSNLSADGRDITLHCVAEQESQMAQLDILDQVILRQHLLVWLLMQRLLWAL